MQHKELKNPFALRLSALEYPHAETFNVANLKEVQTLVAWLEDTVIRFYPVEERKPLRTHNAEWVKHYTQYLSEQGCQRPFDGKDFTLTVDWLVSRGLSLTYQDKAEEYTRVAEDYKEKTKINSEMKELDKNTDYSSEEFKQAVASLARVLELPESDDVEAVLQAISRVVATKFSPSAIEEAKKKGGKKTQSSVSLDDLPLGFNTGDKDVDRAATVLRLLYISDMKELQSKINEIVVAVQNFTADPKADTSLGKVGK